MAHISSCRWVGRKIKSRGAKQARTEGPIIDRVDLGACPSPPPPPPPSETFYNLDSRRCILNHNWTSSSCYQWVVQVLLTTAAKDFYLHCIQVFNGHTCTQCCPKVQYSSIVHVILKLKIVIDGKCSAHA